MDAQKVMLDQLSRMIALQEQTVEVLKHIEQTLDVQFERLSKQLNLSDSSQYVRDLADETSKIRDVLEKIAKK